MGKKILIIAILAAVVIATWLFLNRSLPPGSFNRTENVVPLEARRVLESGERFVLLSLDPRPPFVQRESSPPPKETFHEYGVLGKTEIRDTKDRTELLKALYKGIGESRGEVAGCFNPRHGLSASFNGETVDLLICFECLSVDIRAKDTNVVLTTRSPQPTFDRALERAHLPRAKQE